MTSVNWLPPVDFRFKLEENKVDGRYPAKQFGRVQLEDLINDPANIDHPS